MSEFIKVGENLIKPSEVVSVEDTTVTYFGSKPRQCVHVIFKSGYKTAYYDFTKADFMKALESEK